MSDNRYIVRKIFLFCLFSRLKLSNVQFFLTAQIVDVVLN
jgi:hypothetical protein